MNAILRMPGRTNMSTQLMTLFTNQMYIIAILEQNSLPSNDVWTMCMENAKPDFLEQHIPVLKLTLNLAV